MSYKRDRSGMEPLTPGQIAPGIGRYDESHPPGCPCRTCRRLRWRDTKRDAKRSAKGKSRRALHHGQGSKRGDQPITPLAPPTVVAPDGL